MWDSCSDPSSVPAPPPKVIVQIVWTTKVKEAIELLFVLHTELFSAEDKIVLKIFFDTADQEKGTFCPKNIVKLLVPKKESLEQLQILGL